jgi:hypothetical protein
LQWKGPWSLTRGSRLIRLALRQKQRTDRILALPIEQR